MVGYTPAISRYTNGGYAPPNQMALLIADRQPGQLQVSSITVYKYNAVSHAFSQRVYTASELTAVTTETIATVTYNRYVVYVDIVNSVSGIETVNYSAVINYPGSTVGSTQPSPMSNEIEVDSVYSPQPVISTGFRNTNDEATVVVAVQKAYMDNVAADNEDVDSYNVFTQTTDVAGNVVVQSYWSKEFVRVTIGGNAYHVITGIVIDDARYMQAVVQSVNTDGSSYTMLSELSAPVQVNLSPSMAAPTFELTKVETVLANGDDILVSKYVLFVTLTPATLTTSKIPSYFAVALVDGDGDVVEYIASVASAGATSVVPHLLEIDLLESQIALDRKVRLVVAACTADPLEAGVILNSVGVAKSPAQVVNWPTIATEFTAVLNGNKIDLAWDIAVLDPTRASAYKIFRDSVLIDTHSALAADTTGTYDDTNIAGGAIYDYELQAHATVNDVGFSAIDRLVVNDVSSFENTVDATGAGYALVYRPTGHSLSTDTYLHIYVDEVSLITSSVAITITENTYHPLTDTTTSAEVVTSAAMTLDGAVYYYNYAVTPNDNVTYAVSMQHSLTAGTANAATISDILVALIGQPTGLEITQNQSSSTGWNYRLSWSAPTHSVLTADTPITSTNAALGDAFLRGFTLMVGGVDESDNIVDDGDGAYYWDSADVSAVGALSASVLSVGAGADSAAVDFTAINMIPSPPAPTIGKMVLTYNQNAPASNSFLANFTPIDITGYTEANLVLKYEIKALGASDGSDSIVPALTGSVSLNATSFTATLSEAMQAAYTHRVRMWYELDDDLTHGTDAFLKGLVGEQKLANAVPASLAISRAVDGSGNAYFAVTSIILTGNITSQRTLYATMKYINDAPFVAQTLLVAGDAGVVVTHGGSLNRDISFGPHASNHLGLVFDFAHSAIIDSSTTSYVRVITDVSKAMAVIANTGATASLSQAVSGLVTLALTALPSGHSLANTNAGYTKVLAVEYVASGLTPTNAGGGSGIGRRGVLVTGAATGSQSFSAPDSDASTAAKIVFWGADGTSAELDIAAVMLYHIPSTPSIGGLLTDGRTSNTLTVRSAKGSDGAAFKIKVMENTTDVRVAWTTSSRSDADNVYFDLTYAFVRGNSYTIKVKKTLNGIDSGEVEKAFVYHDVTTSSIASSISTSLHPTNTAVNIDFSAAGVFGSSSDSTLAKSVYFDTQIANALESAGSATVANGPVGDNHDFSVFADGSTNHYALVKYSVLSGEYIIFSNNIGPLTFNAITAPRLLSMGFTAAAFVYKWSAPSIVGSGDGKALLVKYKVGTADDITMGATDTTAQTYVDSSAGRTQHTSVVAYGTDSNSSALFPSVSLYKKASAVTNLALSCNIGSNYRVSFGPPSFVESALATDFEVKLIGVPFTGSNVDLETVIIAYDSASSYAHNFAALIDVNAYQYVLAQVTPQTTVPNDSTAYFTDATLTTQVAGVSRVLVGAVASSSNVEVREPSIRLVSSLTADPLVFRLDTGINGQADYTEVTALLVIPVYGPTEADSLQNSFNANPVVVVAVDQAGSNFAVVSGSSGSEGGKAYLISLQQPTDPALRIDGVIIVAVVSGGTITYGYSPADFIAAARRIE